MAKNFLAIDYTPIPDVDAILAEGDVKTLRQQLYAVKAMSGQALQPAQARRIDESLANANYQDEIEQISNYIVQQIPDNKKQIRHLKFRERSKECTNELEIRTEELAKVEDSAKQASDAIWLKVDDLRKLQKKARIFNTKYAATVTLLSTLTGLSLTALVGLAIGSFLIPPAFPGLLVLGSALLFAGSVFALGMSIAGMNTHYNEHYATPIKKLREKIKDMRFEYQCFMKQTLTPLKHKIYQLTWVGAIFESITNKLAIRFNPPLKQLTFFAAQRTVPLLGNSGGANFSPSNASGLPLLDDNDLFYYEDPEPSNWDKLKGMIPTPFRTRYERV